MNRPLVVLPMVLAVTALGATGQTVLKQALNSIPPGARPVEAVLALAGNRWTYLGVALIGSGTLLWLGVLARTELSYATPFMGLGIVAVMLASAYFLHEPVGVLRVLGTLIIAIGTALVAIS